MQNLQMSLAIYCLCAAVALSACAPDQRASWRVILWMQLTGFAATAGLLLWQPFNAAGCTLLLGAAAAWELLHPPSSAVRAALAGSAAACAMQIFASAGAPIWLAAVLTLAIALAGSRLARQSGDFAPGRMRDQALTSLAIAAPILAAAPVVRAGWISAAALNGAARTSVAVGMGTMPSWVWQSALLWVLFGILHGWWLRR